MSKWVLVRSALDSVPVVRVSYRSVIRNFGGS